MTSNLDLWFGLTIIQRKMAAHCAILLAFQKIQRITSMCHCKFRHNCIVNGNKDLAKASLCWTVSFHCCFRRFRLDCPNLVLHPARRTICWGRVIGLMWFLAWTVMRISIPQHEWMKVLINQVGWTYRVMQIRSSSKNPTITICITIIRRLTTRPYLNTFINQTRYIYLQWTYSTR